VFILASTSPTRKSLLQGAGVPFLAFAPQIDEKQLQSHFAAKPVETMAASLAEAKSLSLGATHPHSIIVGVDQTLQLDGRILHKPENLKEAEKQLYALRGKTHTLTSAICCSLGGEVIWRFEDEALLTMRTFSDHFLKKYLDQAKDDILSSVGGYKLEGTGIQLFENIKGDYFTILGFPLLPLLTFLRTKAIIPS
jgi:septum formation protein